MLNENMTLEQILEQIDNANRRPMALKRIAKLVFGRGSDNDRQAALGDLLADIFHLADCLGLDAGAAIVRGRTDFEAECDQYEHFPECAAYEDKVSAPDYENPATRFVREMDATLAGIKPEGGMAYDMTLTDFQERAVELLRELAD